MAVNPLRQVVCEVLWTILEFLEWAVSVLAGMSPDVMNISILYINMLSVQRRPGEEVSPRKMKRVCRDLKVCVSLRLVFVVSDVGGTEDDVI
jgi:hypothetical protein